MILFLAGQGFEVWPCGFLRDGNQIIHILYLYGLGSEVPYYAVFMSKFFYPNTIFYYYM